MRGRLLCALPKPQFLSLEALGQTTYLSSTLPLGRMKSATYRLGPEKLPHKFPCS